MSHPDRGMAGSEREKPNRPIQPQTTTQPHTTTAAASGSAEFYSSAASSPVSSRSVNFSSVCEWAAPRLDSVGSWPMIGTPEWLSLPDDDPQRWASALDACRHWALLVENNQRAMSDASRAVAAAVDWPAVAREVHSRSSFRANHPESKRVLA